jgi:hypothetical protein
LTAKGRGWIVAGKPAESETNGKTSFHMNSLLQIASVYICLKIILPTMIAASLLLEIPKALSASRLRFAKSYSLTCSDFL